MTDNQLGQLIFGCMFAGKSTEGLRRVKFEKDTGAKVVCVNSSKDTRGQANEINETVNKLNETTTRPLNRSGITTHNSQIAMDLGGVPVLVVNTLSEVDISKYDVILIDESHMYPDLMIVKDWNLKHKKMVIIIALSGDRDLNPFGEASKLLGVCRPYMVNSLSGRCEYCLKEGVSRYDSVSGFTALRKADANIEVVSVGGHDTYVGVCLRHHPAAKFPLLGTKEPTSGVPKRGPNIHKNNTSGVQLIFGPNIHRNYHELIHRLTNHKSSLFITPNLYMEDANFPALDFKAITTLSDIDAAYLAAYSTIGIDEAHRYTDLNETVRKWVLEYGKTVILSSLNRDDDYNTVGEAYKLIPLMAPGIGITNLDG